MKNSLKNNYSSIKFSELNKNDINGIFKQLTSFYKKNIYYSLCQQIAIYTGVAVLELMSMAEFA